MAIDEALLLARIAGDAPPTVRFFGWAPPAVSLGYGQPLDDRVDVAACARLGIGLVRRPTGGSAILHEGPAAELTYSVVARAGDFPGADDVLETYRVLGGGLVAGLRRLGVEAELVPIVRGRAAATPTFCFARTGAYEIAVAGKKLVGSAQRRQAGAFLQHGSILLDADPGRLRAVFPAVGDALAGVTTLAHALGRRVGVEATVDALAAGLGEALGPLAPGELSDGETALAERLVADKYATDAWVARGTTPTAAHA
jgi:lipoate-protein ligase A